MPNFGMRLIVAIIVCPLIMFPGFFLIDADHHALAGVYFFLGGYVWSLTEIHWFEKRRPTPGDDGVR
jgi:hypothetical protein